MPGRTDNAPESWQQYGGGRGQGPSRKKSTRPENEESRRAAGLSQSLEIPLPPGARHERLGSCSLPPTNWVGPFFFLLLFSLNEGFSTRNSPANGLRGGKKKVIASGQIIPGTIQLSAASRYRLPYQSVMIWSNPGTLPKELNLVQELSHHLPRQPRTCKWITRPLIFSCEQQHPCNTPRGGPAAGLHGTGEAAFPRGWMRARGEDAFYLFSSTASFLCGRRKTKRHL